VIVGLGLAVVLGFMPGLHAQAQELPDAFDLDSVVQIALTYNPAVKASQHGLEAAGASREAADWGRYPTVSVQSQRNFWSRDASGNNPDNKATPVSLQVDQYLWTGGRLSAELAVADANNEAAQWGVVEARQALASNVVGAWRSLVSSHEIVLICQAEVARLTMHRDMIDRRVQAQVSPRVDGDLLQSRILQSRLDLTSAQAQRGLMLKRLSVLTNLGLDAKTMQRMREAGQQQAGAMQAFPNDFLAKADAVMESQPAIQRAKAELLAAERAVNAAEAHRYPDVVGRYQYQTDNGTGSGSSASQSSFAVLLNYITGAGLSVAAQARVAVAKASVQRNSVEQLRDDLAATIFSEWQDFSSGVESEAFARETVAESRAIVDSSIRLFLAGRRSWLELLNTERELTQAEKSAAALRSQIIAASYLARMRLGELPWQQAGGSQ
jgi:adhesin transport system outer membrane protein